MNDISPCLTKADKHAVAYGFNGDQSEKTRSMGEKEEQAPTLRADGPAHVAYSPAVANSLGVSPSTHTSPNVASGQGDVVVFDCYNQTCDPHVSKTVAARNDQDTASVVLLGQPNLQVRRLTPVECHRLQGFPDFHCQIPWRGKPADQCPDGPQYKALGNSMAVPCMAWIGERIDNLIFGDFEI